jgi:molybdenum-dependent DNA-binding transcriptional regulator ModE
VHLCGYDEAAIREFLGRFLEEEQFMEDELEDMAQHDEENDDDEVDESTNLGDQADVMELYQQASI